MPRAVDKMETDKKTTCHLTSTKGRTTKVPLDTIKWSRSFLKNKKGTKFEPVIDKHTSGPTEITSRLKGLLEKMCY